MSRVSKIASKTDLGASSVTRDTAPGHLLARLFLRLSDDGERFNLLRIQQVHGKTR